MDLGIPIFLISVQCVALRNLKIGLVDQSWLERNFSVFLLRTLVVGKRQHSESIEVALDMEKGGLMNRFDIGRCHYL